VSDQEIRSSDVAIVGMACRFPGAETLDQFWQNLRDGRETTTFFTDEELLAAGVDPELLADRRYVKAGQLLPDVELFDAELFKIPSEEARILDPQQRHFLECAHEALESAGYDPELYPGAIGVYAGVGMNSYLLHNLGARYRAGSSLDHYHFMLTNDKDYLATRVSYKLNLRGPSVSVNTACSTSLVAVHLACLSLLSGECEMALAGSAHLRTPQVAGYLHQEGMIFSPDGHCRAFDAQARGTILGSGVGVVVLKRLADAVADGDFVHAVIKGTAVNNDGAAKNGYTAPSVDGQAAVVAEAQNLAGCGPETISYVEAHGTGTPLGDPIEVAALGQAFAGAPTRPGGCAIGSVKTNVGHLDTAAGMAGLIKTALMLQHRQLVPSLNFETPNPEIDFASGPFYVHTELAEWPEGATPRRAGVSSFGIGGTNAHAVLEEPPVRRPAAPAGGWELLPLSACSPAALDQAMGRLARHLRRHPELDLADVAYTLGVGRRGWAHRGALVCRDPHDAALTLALGDRDRLLTGRVEGDADPGRTPAVPDPELPASGAIAEPERRATLERLGRLWTRGAAVDWAAFYDGEPRRRVPLPTYPFERKRYWLEPEERPATAGRSGRGELRQRVEAAAGDDKLEVVVDFMQREIARILGGDGSELPDPDTSLFHMDLDSLILIEVAAKLSAELECTVSPDAFVDHYTIRSFVDNLAPALGLPGAPVG